MRWEAARISQDLSRQAEANAPADIRSAPNKADVARTGIVAWYYGICSAASGMTAAMDGSFQDNHADTARQWQERFPPRR